MHGEEEAKKAQKGARALFGGGSADADLPTCEITEEDLKNDEIDLISLLVKAELVPTRSEGRRAIEQGGVSVNGEKTTDVKAVVSKEQFTDGLVLRRGKKNFRKILLKQNS